MLNTFFISKNQNLAGNRFLFMIIFILFYLVFGSFVDSYIGIRILMDILLTFILLSGAYAISNKYYISIIAALLALPMLVSIWFAYFIDIPLLSFIGCCFGIFFFTYIIFHILSFIFRAHHVTLNVIYGAVLVYLLIGFMWVFFYALLNKIEPESFYIGKSSMRDQRFILVYYSFVTLTTLGYGDITPLSSPASSFSILEAIVGQIYMTVLIARLVGIHISQSMKK